MDCCALLGINTHYCWLLNTTVDYWGLLDATWDFRALLGITGHYWGLLDITGNFQALLEMFGHYWRLLGTTLDYWALLGITRQHWRLLGNNGDYQTLFRGIFCDPNTLKYSASPVCMIFSKFGTVDKSEYSFFLCCINCSYNFKKDNNFDPIFSFLKDRWGVE